MTKNLSVSPAVTIDGSTGAQVSHDEASAVQVTATNPDDTSDSHTFWVNPGEKKTWMPPEGWTRVHFTASGFDQESRFISWTAQPLGAEEAAG